jgi:hypothetical protein
VVPAAKVTGNLKYVKRIIDVRTSYERFAAKGTCSQSLAPLLRAMSPSWSLPGDVDGFNTLDRFLNRPNIILCRRPRAIPDMSHMNRETFVEKLHKMFTVSVALPVMCQVLIDSM